MLTLDLVLQIILRGEELVLRVVEGMTLEQRQAAWAQHIKWQDFWFGWLVKLRDAQS
jgi:hypothetical protein